MSRSGELYAVWKRVIELNGILASMETTLWAYIGSPNRTAMEMPPLHRLNELREKAQREVGDIRLDVERMWREAEDEQSAERIREIDSEVSASDAADLGGESEGAV